MLDTQLLVQEIQLMAATRLFCQLANKVCVNSLPLHVSSLVILVGGTLCRPLKKTLVPAAVLAGLICTNTQRVALPMATNK